MAEKICDQGSELIESGGVPINQSELDKNRFENGNLAVQKWEFSEIREVVPKVLLFGFYSPTPRWPRSLRISNGVWNSISRIETTIY